MQFSETFASTCALTIPVLALAGAVESKTQTDELVTLMRRMVKGEVPTSMQTVTKAASPIRVWTVLQILSLIAEALSLSALTTPRAFTGSVLAGTAIVFNIAAILSSLGLLTYRSLTPFDRLPEE
jgi:hypothetical protein